MDTEIAVPQIGVMIDIETLDVGPRSLITQIAAIAFDMEDEEKLIHGGTFNAMLPMEPQLKLLSPRTISAETLNFWMQQKDVVRKKFEGVIDDQYSSLLIHLQTLHMTVRNAIKGADYMIWARGPQFDIVNVESLLHDCGLDAPWRYNRVADLRTIMMLANVPTADIPRPADWPEHDAYYDCRYQINCYFEAKRRLRSV